MQIAQLAAQLQALGLEERQAKVYVATLFLGQSSVQQIAAQADVKRSTTYLVLDELKRLGLVNEVTKSGKTTFVAEPPEELDRYFDAKIKELQSSQKELKGFLPTLRDASRGQQEAPSVRFFTGSEGAKQTSDYARRKSQRGDTIYAFSDADKINAVVPGHLETNVRDRLKKSIGVRQIYSGSKVDVPTDPKLKRQSIKVDSPIAADLVFYQNMIVIRTYDTKDNIGVVIEHPSAAAAFRQLFELAWQFLSSGKINDK
jgi:sugar-specific transcriptional regulator TrmB